MATEIKAPSSPTADAVAAGSGPVGRIVKARVLFEFTRQRLKSFTSAGKRQDLLTLVDLLTTGQVTPVIDRTYPLDEAGDALRYVEAGHTRGEVVDTG